jgi:hypothetical protein
MTLKPDTWAEAERDKFIFHVSKAICEEQSLPIEDIVNSLRQEPWPTLWEKAETYAPFLIDDFEKSVRDTKGGSF